MRALVIAQDSLIMETWRRALEAEWIDAVQAQDGIEAVRLATSHGFDLIVVAGSLGAVHMRVFADLLAGGLFGPSPPPVIVHVGELGDVVAAGDAASSGFSLVNARDPASFAAAIGRAFAGLEQTSVDNTSLEKGDDHA